MSLSQDRMEKALRFLAETDEGCAELRAEMERAEFRAKATKEAIFKRLAGGVAERQAEAASSDEYAQAMEAYFVQLKGFESIRNKRSTEMVVIDVWRTLESSRRKGNV